MSPLDLFPDSFSLQLFGYSVTLGVGVLTAALGWVLFGAGAFFAVRNVIAGDRRAMLPPIVGAAATLASMSAGLGLLLADAYPTFARAFCFPYAVLAIAAAIVGHAMQMGGHQISEE